MGQLYNRSKMDNLHDMMTEIVASFVDALGSKVGSQVELVTACRALEADVVGKSPSLTLPLKDFELTFSLKLDLALECQ